MFISSLNIIKTHKVFLTNTNGKLMLYNMLKWLRKKYMASAEHGLHLALNNLNTFSLATLKLFYLYLRNKDGKRYETYNNLQVNNVYLWTNIYSVCILTKDVFNLTTQGKKCIKEKLKKFDICNNVA